MYGDWRRNLNVLLQISYMSCNAVNTLRSFLVTAITGNYCHIYHELLHQFWTCSVANFPFVPVLLTFPQQWVVVIQCEVQSFQTMDTICKPVHSIACFYSLRLGSSWILVVEFHPVHCDDILDERFSVDTHHLPSHAYEISNVTYDLPVFPDRETGHHFDLVLPSAFPAAFTTVHQLDRYSA